MVSIIAAVLGLTMGKSRPCAIANVKKLVVISVRFGKPKEILDTPSVQCSPNRSRTICMALSVSTALSCSADTVKVRQSINTSSFGIPCSNAACKMRCAIVKRSSAVAGIPFWSIASPITAAPYFLTMGSTRASTSGSPLTELTIALPLTTRRPASSASTLDESICSGKSVTD